MNYSNVLNAGGILDLETTLSRVCPVRKGWTLQLDAVRFRASWIAANIIVRYNNEPAPPSARLRSTFRRRAIGPCGRHMIAHASYKTTALRTDCTTACAGASPLMSAKEITLLTTHSKALKKMWFRRGTTAKLDIGWREARTHARTRARTHARTQFAGASHQ